MGPGPIKMRIRIKLINSYNLIKNYSKLLKFALLIEDLKTSILMSQKYSYVITSFKKLILMLILIIDLFVNMGPGFPQAF